MPAPSKPKISPARTAAFDILLRVHDGAYAAELLHSERMEPLSAADRGLATELVMGVLRWQSRLDAAIAPLSFTPFPKLDPAVLVALRLGAYQKLFLERVPAHAAVGESVELVKRAKKTSAAGLVNAVLRKLGRASSGQLPHSPAARLAAEFAHPEWLVTRWLEHFGEEKARAICEHGQRVPTAALRLSSPAVEEELRAAGIELAPGALLSRARRVISGDIAGSAAVRESRAYIQDEASQLVAALVGRGTLLLDACAAPGGKTSAIAERNPDSLVIAAELHPHRARLMRRLVRAANVCVIAADATQLPIRGRFDRVLADVPCSGTGTLARNPEIKWRLRPADLPELHARQAAILRSMLAQLVPGGRLVYSSCSLEPEENLEVVREVLAGASGIRVVPCRSELLRLKEEGLLAWPNPEPLLAGEFLRTLPGVHPCDGFFAAILERT